jgi:hypothetical protein
MLPEAVWQPLQPLPSVALSLGEPAHGTWALTLVLHPRAAVGVATWVDTGALALFHVIHPVTCTTTQPQGIVCA